MSNDRLWEENPSEEYNIKVKKNILSGTKHVLIRIRVGHS